MDIRVSGHQIETGEALQRHAQDRLNAIVGKYFSGAISSTVTFNRAPAGAFRADIITHVMQGLVLKGAGI
ncbi:MAG: HPF/RaiA family ribosome-associated protein, partial [Novosphingobium sp.]